MAERLAGAAERFTITTGTTLRNRNRESWYSAFSPAVLATDPSRSTSIYIRSGREHGARTRILCDAVGWIRADGRSHKTPERKQKRLNYYPSHESLLLPNKIKIAFHGRLFF
jgi:hypothetical protein